MENLDDIGIGFRFRQAIGDGYESEMREIGRVWRVELSVDHSDGEASVEEDVGELKHWV
jgi:hypothetical protein